MGVHTLAARSGGNTCEIAGNIIGGDGGFAGGTYLLYLAVDHIEFAAGDGVSSVRDTRDVVARIIAGGSDAAVCIDDLDLSVQPIKDRSGSICV